jgi:hypothetical protein
MDSLRLGIALFVLVATAHGQERPPVPSALTPFVSVNAPRVALTHVSVADGTGPPVRTDQTVILPGLGDLRNYELLVQAGFAPEQAIQIMTLNGARILGEEQRIGSMATGKRADLVVVRGDPVRTPTEIYNVVTVFKDGIGFESVKLRAAARGLVGIN